MKKKFYIVLVFGFILTLFIGCPPRPQNPPQNPNDTVVDSNTVVDSLYDYVSKEYLMNYMPYQIGSKFLYVADLDSIVDTLELSLKTNNLDCFYFPMTDIVGKRNMSDFEEEIFGEDLYVRFISLDCDEFNILIELTALLSHDPKRSNEIYVENYFTFNTNALISGAENTCDCTCKDCVLEHCFSEMIGIYENSKLYVTVEQGKGITKFLDDNGVYWHLVE